MADNIHTNGMCFFEEKPEVLSIIDTAYRERCNDEWEHFHGITIETVDNPGWIVIIDFPDIMEDAQFHEKVDEWVGNFRSHGGVDYIIDKNNRFRIYHLELAEALARAASFLSIFPANSKDRCSN